MNANEELELFKTLKLKTQIDEIDCENFLKHVNKHQANQFEKISSQKYIIIIIF